MCAVKYPRTIWVKLTSIKLWLNINKREPCVCFLVCNFKQSPYAIPDSKVYGANMGPIWDRQDPGGPHVGPMNLAICVGLNFGVYIVNNWKVTRGFVPIHSAFSCGSSTGTLMTHYNDVTMKPMASQITGTTIVYSTVCSDADQRKYQISASMALVRGIHSPHKETVTPKMFSFDDVIMNKFQHVLP